MNVTNAIVVYFAIGMPFGVLSIALLRGRVEPGDLFRVIYDLVFWPFIIFKSALAHLRLPARWTNPEKMFPGCDRNDLDIARRADRRKGLSRIAMIEGMNRVYNEMVSASDLSSFFHESVDHPNPELAAKCIQRRSIMRLELHIQASRDEITRSSGGQIFQDISADQMFLHNSETLQRRH
jgi:hypothetical protein